MTTAEATARLPAATAAPVAAMAAAAPLRFGGARAACSRSADRPPALGRRDLRPGAARSLPVPPRVRPSHCRRSAPAWRASSAAIPRRVRSARRRGGAAAARGSATATAAAPGRRSRQRRRQAPAPRAASSRSCRPCPFNPAGAAPAPGVGPADGQRAGPAAAGGVGHQSAQIEVACPSAIRRAAASSCVGATTVGASAQSSRSRSMLIRERAGDTATPSMVRLSSAASL